MKLTSELDEQLKTEHNEQKRLNVVIDDLKSIFSEKGKKLESVNERSKLKDLEINRLNHELVDKNNQSKKVQSIL